MLFMKDFFWMKTVELEKPPLTFLVGKMAEIIWSVCMQYEGVYTCFFWINIYGVEKCMDIAKSRNFYFNGTGWTVGVGVSGKSESIEKWGI